MNAVLAEPIIHHLIPTACDQGHTSVYLLLKADIDSRLGESLAPCQ
jgi:hypothetical protein